ncbi:hypothetical protein [Bacillus sp. Au-Bac7]|uniref:hypothetical protein n=1 Tax=Bacillus sp. Au-Bac7 TaxID=2906458 RepID=UPI001E322E63|nr:hypothetical protein [Bacillus sp. Au-Bac7]MCE4052034.1 hypothetical protein [Bacillus sp. Au-Bac7]
MPEETPQAIEWALKQEDWEHNPVTKDNPTGLVDAVRQYFNEHNIAYNSFAYDDLVLYLK